MGLISQTENGCQAMADSLLVFVPQKILHSAISILVRGPTLAANVTGAIEEKMPFST